MKTSPSKDSRSNLSEVSYKRCLKAVRNHLKENDSIRNRDLRMVTGIGYDQAITFFNRAITEKSLSRTGTLGGTRYVLPVSEKVKTLHKASESKP